MTQARVTTSAQTVLIVGSKTEIEKYIIDYKTTCLSKIKEPYSLKSNTKPRFFLISGTLIFGYKGNKNSATHSKLCTC